MTMDLFDKELLKIFRKKNPDVKPEEVEKWSESHSLWASNNFLRSAQWVDKTVRFLDKDLDNVDVEKFIVNVYGVIIDLPEAIEKKTKVFGKLGLSSHSEVRRYVVRKLNDQGMQIHILQLLRLDEILSDFIQKNFSSEELFATAYYRNTYCHPWLSAYAVKISSKNKSVNFDPEKYEAFLKLHPYDDLDLYKSMHEKLNQHRDTLKNVRELLLALRGR